MSPPSSPSTTQAIISSTSQTSILTYVHNISAPLPHAQLHTSNHLHHTNTTTSSNNSKKYKKSPSNHNFKETHTYCHKHVLCHRHQTETSQKVPLSFQHHKAVLQPDHNTSTISSSTTTTTKPPLLDSDTTPTNNQLPPIIPHYHCRHNHHQHRQHYHTVSIIGSNTSTNTTTTSNTSTQTEISIPTLKQLNMPILPRFHAIPPPHLQFDTPVIFHLTLLYLSPHFTGSPYDNNEKRSPSLGTSEDQNTPCSRNKSQPKKFLRNFKSIMTRKIKALTFPSPLSQFLLTPSAHYFMPSRSPIPFKLPIL